MSLSTSELSRLIDNLVVFATIAVVDHAGRRLKLDIRGRRTGWLAYPNTIGHNMRGARPLRLGTQVLAACPSGNPANAVILATIPTDALPPPETAENLDVIEWNDGSRVEYDSAAARMRVVSVGDLAADAGGNATIKANGNATIEAGGNAAITAGGVAAITAPAITLTATQGGAGAAEMTGSFRLRGDFEIDGSIHATGDILADGANSPNHTHPGL